MNLAGRARNKDAMDEDTDEDAGLLVRALAVFALNALIGVLATLLGSAGAPAAGRSAGSSTGTHAVDALTYGWLLQNLGYYPGFTVAEFVEYFALLKDMPPNRVPAAVADAIEQVSLGEKARAKLRTLSGGMLRRVGIAQAIVNDPQLLLLDEPTAGLDPEQRVAFRAMLREIGQRATVVISTHLVEDIAAACNEVALMHAGKIVFRGSADDLVERGGQSDGDGGSGDSPLERGYAAVLAQARR